jgi:hypothetical protein
MNFLFVQISVLSTCLPWLGQQHLPLGQFPNVSAPAWSARIGLHSGFPRLLIVSPQPVVSNPSSTSGSRTGTVWHGLARFGTVGYGWVRTIGSSIFLRRPDFRRDFQANRPNPSISVPNRDKPRQTVPTQIFASSSRNRGSRRFLGSEKGVVSERNQVDRGFRNSDLRSEEMCWTELLFSQTQNPPANEQLNPLLRGGDRRSLQWVRRLATNDFCDSPPKISV